MSKSLTKGTEKNYKETNRHERATHGQMDRAHWPIRARALLFWRHERLSDSFLLHSVLVTRYDEFCKTVQGFFQRLLCQGRGFLKCNEILFEHVYNVQAQPLFEDTSIIQFLKFLQF